MKNVKTDNNMTLSELEALALAQFEASERKGQAVFHPWVGPASPAPHCVVLPEGLTRIAVTYLDGDHWVENGQWYRRNDDGTVTSIDDVLERCWQAAMAVRSRLKKAVGINAYVVAVAVFPTMEPDESILAAATSRSTRVLFGMDDHVERVAALPGEQDPAAPAAGALHPGRCGGAEPPAGHGRGGTGDGVPGRRRWPRGDPRWHRPPPPPPAHHHRGRSQRRRRRRG